MNLRGAVNRDKSNFHARNLDKKPRVAIASMQEIAILIRI